MSTNAVDPAEAQLRQVRDTIAHAAMLAGERARGAYNVFSYPAGVDAPSPRDVVRTTTTDYYREVGAWCARMARRDSYNTLQLVDVPDWVELTDSLRERALQAAEMVLMAYGVTAEDGDVAVANELAGREYNRLALGAWNAAEHAACAIIGDTDGMTGLALAPLMAQAPAYLVHLDLASGRTAPADQRPRDAGVVV